jgi:hypothetical protein
MRHLVRAPLTRVGRAPDNDVVLEGEDAAVVSSYHVEIRTEDGSHVLHDLASTNGTFVDGERITTRPLSGRVSIRLGPGGPELLFTVEAEAAAAPEETTVRRASTRTSDAGATGPAPAEPPVPVASTAPDDLLSEAVQRARAARRAGSADQTGVIMRQVMDQVVRRSSRRWKLAVRLLVVALIVTVAWAAWEIHGLTREKSGIDGEIRRIEARLRSGTRDPKEIGPLIDTLAAYQSRAQDLQRNLLYQIGVRSPEGDFVEAEIKTLMAEFGAEEYSIPPEFAEEVHRYIEQYQQRDRAHFERVLRDVRGELQTVRNVLESENLPRDLAFMVLVESAFISRSTSSEGANGLWQFTAATARAYGMKVTPDSDERLDIRKSTRAASRYIRELILDFGSGSSVMLALAAYNVGPGKVKRAVRNVEDTIKQRNFWYLYRARALPAETREYVPKIIAAIVIGRNPDRFGF